MLGVLSLYIWWVVSGVLLTVLACWKYLYKFHWFNFWYGLPLIGTMSRLTNSTPDSIDPKWTRAEKKLCTDYAQFIKLGDIDAFNHRAEYLRKAGDLGVKPMPGWVWVFLWLLIIAEGFGFAYALGTWMAMEGSENTFVILMVVVALVIAVPSATLSHEAGVRFHRYMERKRQYQDFNNNGKGKTNAKGEKILFKTENVDLGMKQSVDDGLPLFTHYANRAHKKISLLPLWGAIAWAIVVVVGSTTMRFSHLEKVLAQENVGGVISSQSGNSGNPFAAPDELAQPQAKANAEAGNDIKASTLVEGGAAFFMLAFLYLATQGVGAALSAKHAFLGAQSETAFNGNFGFEIYDDFLRYYEPLEQIAQARLQTLQERLGSSGDDNEGRQLNYRFDDYLKEQHQKSVDRKLQNSTPKAGIPQAVTSKATEVVSNINKQSAESPESAADQAKATIASLADKQAQIEYFANLPASIQEEITPWLKQRKLDEKAKQQAEIKDLF
mgnify:CR=1 FL=1